MASKSFFTLPRLHLAPLYQRRLPRRIAARVFVSILAAEFIVLVPSIINYERERLVNLTTEHGFPLLTGETLGNVDPNIARIQSLYRNSRVKGLAFVSSGGRTEAVVGEAPVTAVEVLLNGEIGVYAGPEGARRSRFETVRLIQYKDNIRLIVIRFDSEHIADQVLGFIARIAAMVLVISLVVCGSTMLILNSMIIRPLFRIRDQLRRARKNPSNSLKQRLVSPRSDEIGQVYQEIDLLLERVAETYHGELGMLVGMIENSPLGALAYDVRGKLIYSNAVCEGMWRGDLVEADWGEAGPSFQRPGGESQTLMDFHEEEFRGEIDLVCADGALRPCLINFARMMDTNGQLIRYHATLTDLSDLRSLQMKLSNAIEYVSEGIALFDSADRLILWNRRYQQMSDLVGYPIYTGIGYEEIVRGAAEFSMPDANAADREAWIRARMEYHEDPQGSYEIRLYKQNWLSVNENRTSEGFTVMVFSNIARLKRRESELAATVEALGAARDQALEANRAKSAFLANMSHELRTPLNAIIGYSQILAEDADRDERTQDRTDLGRIEDAGQHLLRLINSILDLSKVEAGRMEMDVTEFSVHSVLDEAAAIIRPLVKANGNLFETDIAPSIAPIETDQTKLRQILINLLANASKFTEAGLVRLTVTEDCEGDARTVSFKVSDTGIGMTADQLSRLFQPFVQADGSTTRKYGGSGLGLAITKRYAEMMGGFVTVDSVMDEGTEFVLTIPAKFPGAAAELQSTTNEEPTVLVIDDEASYREAIARDIKNAGFNAIQASSGLGGLELARRLQPDAIILDIVMPNVDGWQVLKRLKEDKSTAEIPVIIASVVDVGELAITMGATAVLEKPLELSELLGALGPAYRATSLDVLIVDDDPGFRTLLARIVEDQGQSVRLAANGAEAINKIKQQKPAVMLLDLHMPGLDGFEVLEALGSIDGADAIQTIVITGKDLNLTDTERLSGRTKRVFQKTNYETSELTSLLQSALAERTGDGGIVSQESGELSRAG